MHSVMNEPVSRRGSILGPLVFLYLWISEISKWLDLPKVRFDFYSRVFYFRSKWSYDFANERIAKALNLLCVKFPESRNLSRTEANCRMSCGERNCLGFIILELICEVVGSAQDD
jgi:hypothetical protein